MEASPISWRLLCDGHRKIIIFPCNICLPISKIKDLFTLEELHFSKSAPIPAPGTIGRVGPVHEQLSPWPQPSKYCK